MRLQKPVDFYLIRGLGRESAHWGDFVDQLRQEPFVKDLYCLDLPGTGQYFNEKAPLTIKQNAEFCLEKIHENKNEKVILSISLGSMVGLEMIRLKPDLFKKIIVINTSIANLSPIHHRLQLIAIKRFYNIIRSKNLIERELECLKLISNEKKRWTELSETFAQVAEIRPMLKSNFLRQLIAAATYKVAKEKPQTPILVLSSMNDHMVSPKCSAKLSAHWNLPLLTHPTAGHDLPLDAPEWILKILRESLA